jgi:hypothetical protein
MFQHEPTLCRVPFNTLPLLNLMESLKAEVHIDPPQPLYYPGYYGQQQMYFPQFINPLTGLQAYLANQTKLLANQATLAAATAVAQTKAQVAGTGKAMLDYQMQQAKSNPASILPGKYGNWVRSARYDFPEGGEIDTYNNRLCWGEVCKHDPQTSNDLNMEWLRRAVPIREYPAPPEFHMMHGQLSRPDREFSLIPYDDVKNGNQNCFSKVHPASNVPVVPTIAGMSGDLVIATLADLRYNQLRNFI